jgi:phosphoglycerate dehydrogenase-like enzyme
VLVITSRGAIYDADALCAALRHGPIAAAGVDVFPTEPLPAGHPLTRLPNVILTPHMAGASEEADAAARANVAAVIEAMLDGRGPATAVNVRR